MMKKLLCFMPSTSCIGSNKLAPSPSEKAQLCSVTSSGDGSKGARKSLSKKLCIRLEKVMHLRKQAKELQNESNVKVKGVKRGAKSFRKSLLKVSDVLQVKLCIRALNNKFSEDVEKSDMKAEDLTTSLSTEKLYSKEVDAESEDVGGIALLNDEMDFCTRNELQLTFEKELERRSTEWSIKLEKYRMEEHRLRERVRELVEQNVSLQRKVLIIGEKELDNQSKVIHSGQQVKDVTLKMEEVVKENQNLHQDVLESKEKCRTTEEDRDLFKRNFEAKDKECKELHKAVTRLVRTNNGQDKTIEGLRKAFDKEVNFNQNQQSKMQIEHLRLTGVEQSLRKEVESYRLEVDSLRNENINLLNRLGRSSKDGCFSTFKLDQELQSRVNCLKNQGMCLINDSMHRCSKFNQNIKERGSQNGCLVSQFIMESDMKIQRFKRKAESLTRSLHNASDVLLEKLTPDNEISEDVMKSHLKAEALMTKLPKEKLYLKEVDVERLEAELAAAVRGNDILRCELQNAMDHLSGITHKMKDLEIQVVKKDENIYHLQISLQDCKKELSTVNGILPKVPEKRDMLWEC